MTTMKTFSSTIAALAVLMVLTNFLAACGGSSAASGPNSVHMNDSDFIQHTITIKKGQVVNLVNDDSTVHIIENGTWESNGSTKTGSETGAPKVDYNVSGYGSQTIGPFNTRGTFKLYCTVHPGMNLTVTVQ